MRELWVLLGVVTAQDAADSSLRGARPDMMPADDGNVLVPPYWDLARKSEDNTSLL